MYLTARSNENPAVIEALLNAGAALEARDNELGATPLYAAGRYNENEAIVEALTKAGADDARATRTNCEKWNTDEFFRMATAEQVTACIYNGADLEAKANEDYRPLHMAARYNDNPAVIESLMAAGADLEAKSDYGFWSSGVSQQTPLHYAARYNDNPAVIEALLTAGADLEARNDAYETPLFLAAQYNENPAVVQALLATGTDVMARIHANITPLHMAARYNDNPAVIESLMASGADLEVVTGSGIKGANETPLKWSENNDNPAVHEALLRAGAGQTERQRAAAQARREANSGPGLLAAAIGIIGGTAITAAGGGTEEAAAAGTVFAESVITGQPVGNSGGGGSTDVFGSAGTTGGTAGVGSCLIPGYPSPANPQTLGLAWCPASVDFQVRAFALQAAGAQCAIATGSSSTPAQVQARRREIAAACGRLSALGVSNCHCPTRLGGPGFSQDSSSIEQEEKRRAQRATQQEESRQAAQRERQARQAEAARQAAEREKRSIEANNAEVLNSNCRCIRIKDNGEYTCLDGFVVGNNSSGKPLCDIRR